MPLYFLGMLYHEILMRFFFLLWFFVLSATLLMITLSIYLWKKILGIGINK
ncbi:MAG: hypothetical protein WBB67_03215 [bacterium]